MTKSDVVDRLLAAARAMVEQLNRMKFAVPVEFVYNPLEYVWDGYEQYVTRYASTSIQSLFVGMNPGPWGMAQTGVPFGEVNVVRDWLKITPEFTQPKHAHPLRVIEGVGCRRSEVSGARLWGLFKQHYSTPSNCFEKIFVANYCPLAFMETSARNRTPDKLTASEREQLYRICDQHLATTYQVLQPQWVIGVGQFAEQRSQAALGEAVPIVRILHPSPASPASNRDWAGSVTKQLESAGVW